MLRLLHPSLEALPPHPRHRSRRQPTTLLDTIFPTPHLQPASTVAHRSLASTPFFLEHQHHSPVECTSPHSQASTLTHPSLHLSLYSQLSHWVLSHPSSLSLPLADLLLGLDSTLDLDSTPDLDLPHSALLLLSLTPHFQETTLVALLQFPDLVWADSPACLRCLRCLNQDSTDLPTT